MKNINECKVVKLRLSPSGKNVDWGWSWRQDFPETSVHIYQSTRPHIRGDGSLYSHSCDNLKRHVHWTCWRRECSNDCTGVRGRW